MESENKDQNGKHGSRPNEPMGKGKNCQSEHVVQRYDTEAVLVAEIGRATCIALDRGAAVVCIATDGHRRPWNGT
jgi:hypothetical protein